MKHTKMISLLLTGALATPTFLQSAPAPKLGKKSTPAAIENPPGKAMLKEFEESVVQEAKETLQEMKKGRIFTGRLERILQHLQQQSFFEVVTPEDQEPLRQFAEERGETYQPRYEVIVNLTNENIDSIAQAEARIQAERNRIKNDLAQIQKEITKLGALIKLAEEDNTVPTEQLYTQRADLQEKQESLRTLLFFAGKDENITIFRLARNYIRTVPSQAFKRYNNLRSIDLGDNMIDVVARDAFKNRKQLEMVILSGNKLTELSASAFEGDTKLSFLGLSGTPLAAQSLLPAGTNLHKLKKALPNVFISIAPVSKEFFITQGKLMTSAVLILLILTLLPVLINLYAIFGLQTDEGKGLEKVVETLSKTV